MKLEEIGQKLEKFNNFFAIHINGPMAIACVVMALFAFFVGDYIRGGFWVLCGLFNWNVHTKFRDRLALEKEIAEERKRQQRIKDLNPNK